MMRFGLNMLLWTTEILPSHDPIFEALARIGYDAVEIPVFETGDVESYRRLGDKLRTIGLAPHAVSALSAEQNIASLDGTVRAAGHAALDRMVDCASALGAPTLSGPLHSAIGVFSGAGPTETELKYSIEALSKVAARARPLGVQMAIEPLNRFECYLLNDLAASQRFCDAVGSGAGVLYDTFHAHIEEKDCAKAIRDHARSIALVHISENDRSTPGKGQIRWAETFSALKGAGYDGVLMVEAFGLALPALSAATKIWRRMFEDELTLASDALAFMKRSWEAA
jgi:D-psicose/D-tagatose/L-ribulose 3-epimerase